MNYQVTVGNIGTVYDGTNKREAEEAFQEYMEQSRSGPGWAWVSCEDVALWENGEPIREFVYPGDIEEPLQSVKSGGYNGWTNRETWLVSVWEIQEGIDRNQSVDDIEAELEAVVRDILESELTPPCIASIQAWERVSGFVADFLPSVEDIMLKINFRELAEAHCELGDEDE